MHIRMNVCIIDVIDPRSPEQRKFVVHDEENYAKALAGDGATSTLAVTDCVADLFRLLRDEQWAVVNATTQITTPSPKQKGIFPAGARVKVVLSPAVRDAHYVARYDGRTGTVRLATGPWVYVGFDAGGERVFDASELEHA